MVRQALEANFEILHDFESEYFLILVNTITNLFLGYCWGGCKIYSISKTTLSKSTVKQFTEFMLVIAYAKVNFKLPSEMQCNVQWPVLDLIKVVALESYQLNTLHEYYEDTLITLVPNWGTCICRARKRFFAINPIMHRLYSWHNLNPLGSKLNADTCWSKTPSSP